HTLHEPFTDPRKLAQGIPDNRLMFDQFRSIKDLYFNCVSRKQKSMAPPGLRSRIKRVIYNGIEVNDYIFSAKKDDYYTIVASFSPDKGQGTAAKACHDLGLPLKMAGTIGSGISEPRQLEAAMKDPASQLKYDRGFSYFLKEVAPYLEKGSIEYVGKVTGHRQKEHFARAKAFLFPIDWEEPFGIAVIEALASGTPVVTYNRGAMPEIIKHGVNGFLANSYTEFKQYVKRVGEIDPAVCRRSVEHKFSTEVMAEEYLKLYKNILAQYKAPRLRRIVSLPLTPELAASAWQRRLPI
ncbi:MAG TPA: glycosyltransferase, partial [Candidatus Saccharimonadales bacterium]|nr:glycosyltransferase [Candidatus Saccharimonadales bacterium]